MNPRKDGVARPGGGFTPPEAGAAAGAAQRRQHRQMDLQVSSARDPEK
jgi:hypothetical protein